MVIKVYLQEYIAADIQQSADKQTEVINNFRLFWDMLKISFDLIDFLSGYFTRFTKKKISVTIHYEEKYLF